MCVCLRWIKHRQMVWNCPEVLCCRSNSFYLNSLGDTCSVRGDPAWVHKLHQCFEGIDSCVCLPTIVTYATRGLWLVECCVTSPLMLLTVVPDECVHNDGVNLIQVCVEEGKVETGWWENTEMQCVCHAGSKYRLDHWVWGRWDPGIWKITSNNSEDCFQRFTKMWN